MDDLISRQDAYETLTDYYHHRTVGQHEALWDALKRVPSAEPEADLKRKWIPCSERLPEIGEHYESEPCIVYCSNGAYGFTVLEENFFGQVGWNCERDDEYHEPLGEVIAWMPLPKPYKEEQE